MSTRDRPLRSVLYMPASNARALEKAKSLPADAIVLDLEDAVAPEAKDTARRQAVAALASGAYGPRTLVLRVNGLDTEWGRADLAAAAASPPAAILLPKPSSADDLRNVQTAMDAAGLPVSIELWAMVETARALVALGDFAAEGRREGSRLAALVVGLNDLYVETRARPRADRWTALPWLSAVVTAARAGDLVALDSVCNDFRDAERLGRECEQARDLGFDGKTLIHPDQIALANEMLAPSAEEIAEARAIVAAFEKPEHAGKGAIRLDGRMVELLHAAAARRTLARAAAMARPAHP
jgi:citrate lyase subunit beta/citryl-CoA lyase